MMREFYKKISDISDYYEVSTLGNVRSFKAIECGLKLKTHIDKYGYEKVSIRHNGKTINKFVHRLVAEAFIPKIKGKNQVNHKDGNKLNNVVTNLEWCNTRENVIHGWINGLNKKFFGKDHWLSKKVFQYDLHGNIIDYFNGVREASRETGISRSGIGKCCNGKQHTCGGFIWKYEK